MAEKRGGWVFVFFWSGRRDFVSGRLAFLMRGCDIYEGAVIDLSNSLIKESFFLLLLHFLTPFGDFKRAVAYFRYLELSRRSGLVSIVSENMNARSRIFVSPF